jgi:hypothetical protein
MPRPIDEPHTEALLQSRDELCHGVWRQADVLGCARKAAALRQTLENGHLGLMNRPFRKFLHE